MFKKYQDSLDKWNEYGIQFCGCSTSLGNNLNLIWEETFSIEEIPKNNPWNTSATSFKLWQEDLYLKWGYTKESTKHYMCFEPQVNYDLDEILKIIKCNPANVLYNFMKVPPGSVIPWHCDTYGYFIKKFDITPTDISKIKRAVVFIEDWHFGQLIQFGKDILHSWKQGDIYSWDHEAWHGAANFGNQDLIIMQVTYCE
jgi:hypothetical protein